MSGEHFGLMEEENWGTPSNIVEKAREFLGGSIDLDPASDAFRNQTVKAKTWLGLPHVGASGIPENWGDAKTVFCNPPGGKHDRKTFVSRFWRKAVEHCSTVEGKLVWVAYNINQLQTLQQEWAEAVRASCVCIPDLRISYIDRIGVKKSGTPSASAILGLSGDPEDADRFQAIFGSLGAVWIP